MKKILLSIFPRNRIDLFLGTVIIFYTNCLLTSSFAASSDYYCNFEVIGYYPDYRQMPIPEIRYDKISEAVFFSIYPNTDGTLNTSQIDLTRQRQFVNSAKLNNTKVAICIGGWKLSGNFPSVCANAGTRSIFTDQLLEYCQTHNYDGLVLDWEPVSNPTDQSSYALLIEELKSDMTPYGLTLGVAVTGLGNELTSQTIEHIDRLHIMAYDMELDPSLPHSTYERALEGIAHWEDFGFPKSKIILGLPFYGRDSTWTYHPYRDIVRQYQPAADVDTVNGIHFNGINTIKAKTRYMVTNDFAGVMFWEVTQDTDDHISLLTAISDEIHFNSPPDYDCNETIDISDLSHLVNKWLMTECRPGNSWCDVADLNQSGSVNLEDVSIFAQSWIIDD